MNTFNNLTTAKPVCFGYFSSNPPISVWLAYVTDIEKSEIACFTAENPGYNIENWLLVPKRGLTWTREQITDVGYRSLQDMAEALEKEKEKIDLTRSERIKETILNRTWRRPANQHKLIWRFRVRVVEEVGEVLSIVWTTKTALEAFKKRQHKQLQLFVEDEQVTPYL